MKITKEQFVLLDEYLLATIEEKRTEVRCTDGGDNRHYDAARKLKHEARKALETVMVGKR